LCKDFFAIWVRDLRVSVPATLCETRPVRLSDFWRLMDDEFGAGYARSLARDHVLGALGNRTAAQAHDRAFAELLVNLGKRCVARLLAIRGCGNDSQL